MIWLIIQFYVLDPILRFYAIWLIMMSKESIMSELARSPEQLGNTIRRARKKLSMSQSELGERAGLRQETISLIENGNPAARLETILSVLSALGLEMQIAKRSEVGLRDVSTIRGIKNIRSVNKDNGEE